MPDAALPVLALDVGGTHVRMAIVDGGGRIRERRCIAAHLTNLPTTPDTNETVTRTLDNLIAKMLDQHPGTTAIGLGFPGFIHKGVVQSSPNIPGLSDLPLATRLGRRFGLPVAVENDAALAALGESRFGKGAPLPFLLHLTLGTGVGGGLVLDGKPYAGEGGMAMEIGHLCVRPGGRQCGCGNRGCLEAYASATGIVAGWREAAGASAGPGVDARAIHQRALEGDAPARQALEEAGQALGQALAQAVNLLDVHHVRIGGGVIGAWDLLEPPLRDALEACLIPPIKGTVSIAPSCLGDDAALLGAALLAREACGKT